MQLKEQVSLTQNQFLALRSAFCQSFKHYADVEIFPKCIIFVSQSFVPNGFNDQEVVLYFSSVHMMP